MRQLRYTTLLLIIIAAIARAQPAHTRLLIIGDSLSLGLAASSEETTYRALLTAALESDTAYIAARTLAGVPDTIPPADIIILEIGLNDVLMGAPPIAESDWPAAYGAVLDRLQAAAPLVVAATPMHALYSAHEHYGQMDRYAGYIREAAGTRGIAVADLWAIEGCIPACLSQEGDATPFPPLYHGDNFHPNDLGHYRIAQAVLWAIRPRVYVPAIVTREGITHP